MTRFAAAFLLFLVAAPAIAQDMALSQILRDGEVWVSTARGFKAVQGLAADQHGFVYVADRGSNQVLRLGRDAPRMVFAESDGVTQGLFFAADGRLYGCQPDRRMIVAWNTEGKESVIARNLAAHELIVTAKGSLYCSVPSEQAVYFVSPDGKRQKFDPEIAAPAGFTLTPDGGTLMTTYGSSKYLWTSRVEPDGRLSHKEHYGTLRLPPGQTASGGGGMTVDTAGRLYVATRLGVQIFDPTGRMCGVLTNPAATPPTALAFGGPNGEVLYAAHGDQIFARKTNAKGVLFQHPRNP